MWVTIIITSFHSLIQLNCSLLWWVNQYNSTPPSIIWREKTFTFFAYLLLHLLPMKGGSLVYKRWTVPPDINLPCECGTESTSCLVTPALWWSHTSWWPQALWYTETQFHPWFSFLFAILCLTVCAKWSFRSFTYCEGDCTHKRKHGQ